MTAFNKHLLYLAQASTPIYKTKLLNNGVFENVQTQYTKKILSIGE